MGADGDFYQPREDRLTKYALTDQWRKKGVWGNRAEKAPYRYLGRYFYTTGEVLVSAPAGMTRVEAFKGFEHQPQSTTIAVVAGTTVDVELRLTRTATLTTQGWFGGDLDLHFPRTSDEDEAAIFDLLEAEDVVYGTALGYNEPAGPYHGTMDKMDAPQQRGLGRR